MHSSDLQNLGRRGTLGNLWGQLRGHGRVLHDLVLVRLGLVYNVVLHYLRL